MKDVDMIRLWICIMKFANLSLLIRSAEMNLKSSDTINFAYLQKTCLNELIFQFFFYDSYFVEDQNEHLK